MFGRKVILGYLKEIAQHKFLHLILVFFCTLVFGVSLNSGSALAACQADGWSDEELVWDGWVPSGYEYCDYLNATSGGTYYCSRATMAYAWVRWDCSPLPPPPPQPPSCTPSTTSSSQSCGGGWQNGTITTTTKTNSDCSTSQSSSDTCGCNPGYSWNGSSCASTGCTPSTTSSSQYCGGGWQTGTITTTTKTNSDCSTSQSSTDTCGCYSGYSWNGSSCVANTPPPPSCTPSTTSSNVSCSAHGWQTGVITTTKRTYSDCSVNEGSTDNCGCYSGYSWNGSFCEADASPEDGSCGGSLNSCNSGSFGDVGDSSTNYQWNCYGIAGGSSTGCSQAKPGQCGFASGNSYSSAPVSSSALCTLGSSSTVSGSGPWAWTCTTSGGTANCSSSYCAPPIAGVCNNGTPNACSVGNLADLADSSTHYLWQCTGLNGGADSPQCSTAKPPVINGSCGSSLNACNAGIFSDTADDSANYNWQCLGANGGADSPQCSITIPPLPVAGACGPSNNICNAGSLNDTTDDSTNYNWQCLGSNGGPGVNCSQAKPPQYSYAWSQGGFGSCSLTCGGGTQTQSVTCQRNDGQTVADGYCSSAKPSTSQSCNTQACVASCTGPVSGIKYGHYCSGTPKMANDISSYGFSPAAYIAAHPGVTCIEMLTIQPSGGSQSDSPEIDWVATDGAAVEIPLKSTPYGMQYDIPANWNSHPGFTYGTTQSYVHFDDWSAYTCR